MDPKPKSHRLFIAVTLSIALLTACSERSTAPRQMIGRVAAAATLAAPPEEAAPAEEAPPADDGGCPAGFKPIPAKPGDPTDKNANGIVCSDGVRVVDDSGSTAGSCPPGFVATHVKFGDPADVNGNGIVCVDGKIVVDDDLKTGAGSVNGHGNFFSDGQDISFSFHGQTDKDGKAKGTFEMHDQTNGLNVHGEVTCLSIVGNTATLNGIVTKSDDEGLPATAKVAWQAVDNGEGADAALDLVSRLATGLKKPIGGCAIGKINFAKVVSGNIQVK